MLFLCILAAVLFLLLAILFIVYRIIFYSSNKAKKITYAFPVGEQYEAVAEPLQKAVDKMLARPFESVHIRAKDGTKLFARYYHVKDGAPVHILVHGWRGYAVLDCSGGSSLAEKLGHNALVVDQRANGKSGGNCISFGVREREDCLSWIHYICERFSENTPIILSGVSMGAATVLMTAGLTLPDNVRCVMADCPFTSAKDIIKAVAKNLNCPPRLVAFFASLSAIVYGHFVLGKADALSAIKNTKLPILILHGEEDHFVPCDMGRELYHTNPEQVQLETFPNAGHGLSYVIEPAKYEAVVISFLEKHLA